MELEIYPREKKQTKKLRKLKNIPAILYGKGRKNENIYVKQEEIKKILSHLQNGDLSTSIFTLKSDKKSFRAIVKDIQYFVTTYDLQHIDFMVLDDKTKVVINVPIKHIGLAECIGIKQGGNFHQMIRKLKVKCLPKYIPKEFVLDISQMQLGEKKRLSHIEIPKEVECIEKNLKEVVLAITKR